MKIEVNEGTEKNVEKLIYNSKEAADKDKNRDNYDNYENTNKYKGNDSCDIDNLLRKNNTYTISDQYVFRCGKVGPCGTIEEVLR